MGKLPLGDNKVTSSFDGLKRLDKLRLWLHSLKAGDYDENELGTGNNPNFL